MYNLKEKDFESFIIRWLDGIEAELCFWSLLISDDKRWDSHMKNKRMQETSMHTPGIKKVLDVGSGPTSVLFPDKNKFIVTCDPLAEYYKLIIKKYNRMPIIETDFCFSERLYERYEANFFDEVNMKNALDHSFLPMNTIYNLLYVLKINGKITLKHFRNEADHENYAGFHQFNIDSQNGEAVIWNKEIRIVLSELLRDIAQINCYSEVFNKREFVIIEIIKNKHFDILDYISSNYYFDKYIFLTISKIISNHAKELYNHNTLKFEEDTMYINKEIHSQIVLLRKKFDYEYNKLKNNYNNLENKINDIINILAWWIPVKKWRDNFRNKFRGEERRGEERRGVKYGYRKASLCIY